MYGFYKYRFMSYSIPIYNYSMPHESYFKNNSFYHWYWHYFDGKFQSLCVKIKDQTKKWNVRNNPVRIIHLICYLCFVCLLMCSNLLLLLSKLQCAILFISKTSFYCVFFQTLYFWTDNYFMRKDGSFLFVIYNLSALIIAAS